MAIGNRVPVPPPAFTPRRYGLFSVAQMVTEESWEWRNGVVQERASEGCAPTGGIWVQPCPPTDPDPKDDGTSDLPLANGGDAFTVYAGALCSPVGISAAEFDRRAQARLLAGEETAVELVLQGNALVDVAPNFEGDQPTDEGFDTPTLVNLGTEGTAAGAMSALEGFLAECYGGRGVVHVPAAGVPFLADASQLIRNGGVLETYVGNLVAVHANNPGTSGDVSMWVTGAVAVRRSGVEMLGDFTSSMDRDKNTVNRRAERTYVLTWDCCLAGLTLTD